MITSNIKLVDVRIGQKSEEGQKIISKFQSNNKYIMQETPKTYEKEMIIKNIIKDDDFDVVEYEDGSRFEGKVSDQLPNGNGRMKFANGD